LLSDQELLEEAAERQAKLAAVKEVQVRVRFPDNTQATWKIHPDHTGEFLHNAVRAVMALTHSAGVDVAIEAVGVPATFDVCQGIVGPGGRIANIGVHGKSVELHLERLWSHNITLTTRLVDTVTTPMLLKLALSGRLQPLKLVTHRFRLDEAMKAYDTFGSAARERALKVVLKNA